MSVAKQVWRLLRETAEEWRNDNASRLAAALAYYALLSMAPLLIVTVAILGVFMGEASARASIEHAMGAIVGRHGVAALETIGHSANVSGASTLATLLGLGIALFGASGAFMELQAAFDAIWSVPPKRDRVLVAYLVDRFWSFMMVLGVAALLLCSLVSSAVLVAVGEFFQHLLPGANSLWQLMHASISLSVISGLLAIMFKVLPQTRIAWADVWLGSLFTGLLFVLGNSLLGTYLGTSGVTSSYGGAGSVVGFMIWVYWSAQLLFFGAEFTHVYAKRHGSLRFAPDSRRPDATRLNAS